MNASVSQLPLAMTLLAPEITTLDWPEETQSDCKNCPLAGNTFLKDVRCCTYEPAVPNFLVGRALRRNDTGSQRIRERIRRGGGLSPLGIRPTEEWTARYERNRDTDFGRNAEWRCPYWVAGPLSCSIWRDRNAACRTWHCKHTEGVRAHHLWTAARKLLHGLEGRLAAWCVAQGTPPKPTAKEKEWAAWFQRCAHAVEQADAESLLPLRDEELQLLRDNLAKADRGRSATMPEILGIEVRNVIEHGEEVELVGYTPWNTRRYPRTIFILLAELDGQRTWREALQRAQAADPSVCETWITQLWDHDILRAPGDPTIPWGFEGPDLDPETLQARFGRR